MAGIKSKTKPAGNGERIIFSAKLLKAKGQEWLFFKLPVEASGKLPSRGLNTVLGSINGAAFTETLQPDGQGGHWMKLPQELIEKTRVKPGDEVDLEMAPTDEEPEPRMPVEFQKALAAASPKARETWAAITAMARRDWIHWMESAKQEATRLKRMESGCDMLGKGKRRPCCFDRSGMYSKSLCSPESEE